MFTSMPIEDIKKEAERGIMEYDLAWNEFFKNRPRPKNDDEEQKEMIEFAFWYNNVRPQSDTGKTPAEMRERIIEYGETSREEEAAYEKQLAMDDILGWIQEGKYQDAFKECNYQLESEPNNVELLLLKFEALTGMNKMPDAEKLLEKCSILDPENPYLHFHSASMHLMKRDFSGALEKINGALEKDEKNFDFLVLKAQILFLINDRLYIRYLKEAEAVDRRRLLNFLDTCWFDTYPEPDEVFGILEKGNACLFEKDVEGAFQELTKLDAFPLTKPFREVAAVAKIRKYLDDKDLPSAKKYVSELFDEKDVSSSAFYYQAKIDRMEEHPENALQAINNAIAIAEKSNQLDAGNYLEKAEILAVLGDESHTEFEEKAKKIQQKVIKRAMKDAEKMGKKCITKDGLIKFEWLAIFIDFLNLIFSVLFLRSLKPLVIGKFIE